MVVIFLKVINSVTGGQCDYSPRAPKHPATPLLIKRQFRHLTVVGLTTPPSRSYSIFCVGIRVVQLHKHFRSHDFVRLLCVACIILS